METTSVTAMSMYEASVPAFLRGLASLKRVLEKAAAHAEARKIEPAALLQARLYPDMFPLTRQVHIATDFARGTCARLAGAEPPSWEDTENSFAELIGRVDRTIAFIREFDASRIDGSEGREIVRPVRGKPHRFTGIRYLTQFSLPNFYFHLTTAYAILRHNGVELGKSDFIGPLD
jgi:hypothetical protein